ncbi:MAG: RimK family alpha-L-glutamate ligase, partial [Pseudomonadota bacterium]
IPGFEDRLPDGAFVRAISTGTLEQITLRLGLLHALEAAGVCVWNSADAIERCVDKAMALQCFHRAGLPIPKSVTTEELQTAKAFASSLLQDDGAVLKPLFGSQGNGVRRIHNPEEVFPSQELGGVYHLQRYIPTADAKPFSDLRLLVSGERVIAGMKRSSPTWPTNVHQGGAPLAMDITPKLNNLAVRAAQAVGAGYAGIDLMMDKNGKPHLIEINSNPAWKGSQSVTELNIAENLIEDFLKARAVTAIATAFENACAHELTAIKPGNVHIFRAGHRMTVDDFARSAMASAPFIAKSSLTVGQRIKAAVAATNAAVNCNTNLGICLLCAPLAVAAQSHPLTPQELRSELAEVLESLTIQDAEDAYAAIRLASPAGLGNATKQDVNATPQVTLLATMALAAERDRIANAYTNTYDDIFTHALPKLEASLKETSDTSQAVSRLYMSLLSKYPDSHIARKHGIETARQVMQEAKQHMTASHQALLDFDADLQQRGLNPGTSADLVVATLFAHELLNPSASAPRHVYACLKS